MCNAISMIASGVKTLTQVNSIGRETQFQLNEDQANIRLSQYAEEDAKARGGLAAGEARMEGSQLAATQGFLYANSGVDATVGTAANVQAATAALAEKDALTIKNNAAREAWGHAKTTKKLKTQMNMNLGRANDRMTATILGGLADGASAGAKGS